MNGFLLYMLCSDCCSIGSSDEWTRLTRVMERCGKHLRDIGIFLWPNLPGNHNPSLPVGVGAAINNKPAS